MNDFESERAAKAARFRQLAEKHENIATGRHFAALPKTFHVEDTKWWLLELIPIEPKEGK